MKNISRRVFIKGMAVAAVATAASTVLTGCKLPTEELPTEEVPSVAQSQTYEETSEKVLTVSSTALTVVSESNMAVLSMKVVNKTSGSFQVVKSTAPTTAGAYYVVADDLKIYFDGREGNYVTPALVEDASNLVDNVVGGTAVAVGYSATGKLYIKTPKTWNKMTIVAAVKKCTDASNTNDYTVKTMEFNFNK